MAPLGSAIAAEGPKWVPYADIEGKLGTDRNLGEASLFVPLGQSNNSLVFGNLITRLDDQDSFEGNVGLGYREIVDGNYILGGYAFFDRRKSASDNYFNQITAGAEFMTDVWTARSNVYFADNDLAPTSGGVVTQTGTQIFVQSNMEGALSGFDAEVGRVIPLGLDDVTLTGFAGGFHFGRSGFDNVSGPRGRAELSFNNLWDDVLPSGTQLRFGAEVQHDDVRDTQGFLSARLRVPLFGGRFRSNLSPLDQRMVDPVVRDIDIVGGTSLTAPTAPVLASNGRTLRSANVVDADDDLGVALAAAGVDSVVIVDGSKGVITSVAEAVARTGQAILGAQGAGLNLMDPNTGQSIRWSPGGVRPTLSNLTLSLPGSTVASGLDFNGAYLQVGQSGFLLKTDDVAISDMSFGGTYAINQPAGTTRNGFVHISNATNVSVDSLRFSGITVTNIGGADISAVSIDGTSNVALNDISVTNSSLSSGGFLAKFVGLSVGLGSSTVDVSGLHVNGLTATDTAGLAVPAFMPLASTGAIVNGVFIEGASSVTVRDSSFQNLTATSAAGAANTTGVSRLGGGNLTLNNVQISGLTEAGTDATATVGIDLGRGAGVILGTGILHGGGNVALAMEGVSLSGVTNAIEFNSQIGPLFGTPAPSTATVSGSGNVLGTGVGGCVNNLPAQITVAGSVGFTNGSSCP